MSKVRDISGLANIIKTDANGNVTFVSGSTTLMAISSSGAVTSTGTIGGSNSATLATTGSNTFTGQQYISNTNAPVNFTDTASLYTDGGLRVGKDAYVSGTLYLNDLTVYGTQSVNYITSSQLDIADNIITVNTSTPAIRFGGIAVRDSGSLGTGLTGSLLWDSQNNHWVYTNPSGSSYSGGMMISGPRASSLGEEQGTTFNALMKGQGGDHITSSGIFENGVSASFYNNALVVNSSGIVGIGKSNPSEIFDVNTGQGARAGMALTGEYPYLRFNVSSSNANARNWAFNATNAEPGDFALLQSTAKDGNPVTAGASILGFGRSGAATFTSTVTSKGLVVVGASGGYTTGDNTYINLGGSASPDTFGAINAPFGDVMKFNSYHGYQFKTSNSTASPVTMFSIGIGGAATFASSVTLNGDLNLAGSAEINHTGRMLFDAGAGNGFLFRVNNVATQALSIDSTGASTFPISVISTKFNTFNGSLSVANNTATFMQACGADNGTGSIYLIVAAIGGAGSDRIAMGILVTISQGGGTARWAFQNNGANMFLTDPDSNGNVYVRHTVGGTSTVSYSVLRIA